MAVSFSMKAPSAILSVHGLSAGGAVQRYIDREVLVRCEPFVPKKSGTLIASGYAATQCGSGVVSYSAPYAAYQYYGRTADGNAIKYNGAPMRGSYWFERMKSVHGAAILRGAAALAGNTRSVPETQTVITVLGLRRNPVFAYK